MPPILDLAIGLLFVYLLFSLVVTAARELCVALTSSAWDKRAELLKKGIGELFGDRNSPDGFSNAFFKHPLINALSPPKANALPNYIPRETFVSTVLDLIAKPNPCGPRTADQILTGIVGTLEANFIERARSVLADLARKYPADTNIVVCFTAFNSVANDAVERGKFATALGYLKSKIAAEITIAAIQLVAAKAAASAAPEDPKLSQSQTTAQTTHDALVAQRLQIEKVESLLPQLGDSSSVASNTLNGELRITLMALFEDAGHDVEEFKKHLGDWFDHSMDRVTGWYKKYTQCFILVLGLVLAIVCNVDSLRIIDALSTDSALREQIVKNATDYVTAAPSLIQRVREAEAKAETAGASAAKETDPAKKAIALKEAEELEQAAKKAGEARDAEIVAAKKAVADAEANLKAAENALSKESDPLKKAAIEKTVKEAEMTAKLAREKLDKLLNSLKDAVRTMNGFGLPIGWHNGDWERTWRDIPTGVTTVLGWLMTALAASLGAPFWFDTLNKIVTIRAGGRAPEEKDPGENRGKGKNSTSTK